MGGIENKRLKKIQIDENTGVLDPAKLTFGVYSGGMSMALGIGVALATKNINAAAAVLSTIESTDEYQQVKKTGGSPQKALAVAGISGLGTYHLEKLGFEFMFKNLNIGRLASAGIKSIVETIQESSQTLWQNTVAKVGYDKARPFLSDMTETILYTLPIGFLAGGTFDTIRNNTVLLNNLKTKTGLSTNDLLDLVMRIKTRFQETFEDLRKNEAGFAKLPTLKLNKEKLPSIQPLAEKASEIPPNVKKFVDEYNNLKQRMDDKFAVLKEENKIPDKFDMAELNKMRIRMSEIENGNQTNSLKIKPYLDLYGKKAPTLPIVALEEIKKQPIQAVGDQRLGLDIGIPSKSSVAINLPDTFSQDLFTNLKASKPEEVSTILNVSPSNFTNLSFIQDYYSKIKKISQETLPAFKKLVEKVTNLRADMRVKKENSYTEKVERYILNKKNPLNINDVLAGRIMINSTNEAINILNNIKANINTIETQDFFQAPTVFGYRGINIDRILWGSLRHLQNKKIKLGI